MRRADVSAVVVTRGEVNLSEIRASLAGFGELIVWDNAVEPDLAVYGRYAALEQAAFPVVYVQDDDCLVDNIDTLLALYEPGVIVANMPVSRWHDYPDSCLVGWGAVFDRELPARAFARLNEWPMRDAHFERTCDVAFTTLTPHRKIDVGFQHLPWAETASRMFKQPGHQAERDRMLRLARRVRDGVAA